MIVPEDKLKTLKQKVIQAFADVPSPKGDITLCKWDECRDINKDFTGKDWKTIESEIIRKNHNKLSFFLPQAFHYFFPAYLIYSLENFHYEYFRHPYDDTCEYTIYQVAPTQKSIENNFGWWQERFGDFTLEQINCAYEFLDLVSEDKNFDTFFEDVETGKQNLKKLIESILRKREIL
jgi:hypothetical protein